MDGRRRKKKEMGIRLQRGMKGKEGWGRRMVKEEKKRRQWEENEVSEERRRRGIEEDWGINKKGEESWWKWRWRKNSPGGWLEKTEG